MDPGQLVASMRTTGPRSPHPSGLQSQLQSAFPSPHESGPASRGMTVLNNISSQMSLLLARQDRTDESIATLTKEVRIVKSMLLALDSSRSMVGFRPVDLLGSSAAYDGESSNIHLNARSPPSTPSPPQSLFSHSGNNIRSPVAASIASLIPPAPAPSSACQSPVSTVTSEDEHKAPGTRRMGQLVLTRPCGQMISSNPSVVAPMSMPLPQRSSQTNDNKRNGYNNTNEVYAYIIAGMFNYMQDEIERKNNTKYMSSMNKDDVGKFCKVISSVIKRYEICSAFHSPATAMVPRTSPTLVSRVGPAVLHSMSVSNSTADVFRAIVTIMRCLRTIKECLKPPATDIVERIGEGIVTKIGDNAFYTVDIEGIAPRDPTPDEMAYKSIPHNLVSAYITRRLDGESVINAIQLCKGGEK